MDNKILKLALNIAIISSILITIVTRLNIDSYTKNCILPIMIILTSYTYFVCLLKEEINLKAYWYLFTIIIILLSHFIVPLAPVNKILNLI